MVYVLEKMKSSSYMTISLFVVKRTLKYKKSREILHGELENNFELQFETWEKNES